MRRRSNQARLAALALVALFWGMAVLNVERFPPVYGDEAWILSPGYKLFTRGVYGSDLFAGFNRMEERYLEFMPVFPILQGAVTWLMGMGVMQMRYLPVVSGVLTLALTFALAHRLFSARVGVLAVLLLAGWRLTPGTTRYLGSGIALLDVARIARYDVLVAPLGLGAAWAAWHARSGPLRYSLLSGFLVGLAGLTHVYGLIWVITLLMWVWMAPAPRGMRLRQAMALLGSAFCVWMPWLLTLFVYQADFVAQMRIVPGRWDVWEWSFYWDNLRDEIRRYALGVRTPATFLRPGFWLFAVGLPLAATGLGLRALRRDRPARLWLIPTVIFPVLFALLLKPKSHTYLATALPLFAVTLAWGWMEGRPKRSRWLALALILVLAEGVMGLAHLQVRARQVGSPTEFYRVLRSVLPANGRLLGPNQYWIGLSDRDYRYLGVAMLLSAPFTTPKPLSFDEALTRIRPDVLLVETELRDLSESDEAYIREWAVSLAAFMRAHQARVVAVLRDAEGQEVEVYQLEWDSP